MKKTYARRLLKLADFLDALPPSRFDYSCWVGKDWGGKQDLSCGTTACALGWAATMPEFRRLGLRIYPTSMEGGCYSLAGVVALAEDEPYLLGHEDLIQRAAEKVFGVNQRGFEALFVPKSKEHAEVGGPGSHAKSKQVARLIRCFVEAGSYEALREQRLASARDLG